MKKRMEERMTFFTIRKKLILILVGLPVIPLLVFSLYFLGNIKTDVVQSFVSSTNRELAHVNSTFVFFMEGMKSVVRTFASTPEFRESYGMLPNYTETTVTTAVSEENLEKVTRKALGVLRRTKASSPLFLETFLGTEDGGMLNAGLEMPAGFDPRKRDWYQRAFSVGEAAVTPAYLSITGDVVVSIVNPVLHGDGRRLGAVGIDVSLQGLADMIKNTKIGDTGYIILVQEDGAILAHPRKEEFSFKKIDELNIPAFTALAGMRDGYTEVELPLYRRDYQGGGDA